MHLGRKNLDCDLISVLCKTVLHRQTDSFLSILFIKPKLDKTLEAFPVISQAINFKIFQGRILNLNHFIGTRAFLSPPIHNTLRGSEPRYEHSGTYEVNLVPRARDLQEKNRELWDNP